MATIDDYKSGKAAKAVKQAYEAMQNLDKPLVKTKIASIFANHVKDLVPMAVNPSQALEYIKDTDRCAIGERLCRCEFPETPSTCAVFLDELADAMVSVGKADYATPEAAMDILAQHRGRPMIVSKIEGKYMEICRTWPGTCFYWNLEKHGMKCIRRRPS